MQMHRLKNRLHNHGCPMPPPLEPSRRQQIPGHTRSKCRTGSKETNEFMSRHGILASRGGGQPPTTWTQVRVAMHSSAVLMSAVSSHGHSQRSAPSSVAIAQTVTLLYPAPLHPADSTSSAAIMLQPWPWFDVVWLTRTARFILNRHSTTRMTMSIWSFWSVWQWTPQFFCHRNILLPLAKHYV